MKCQIDLTKNPWPVGLPQVFLYLWSKFEVYVMCDQPSEFMARWSFVGFQSCPLSDDLSNLVLYVIGCEVLDTNNFIL